MENNEILYEEIPSSITSKLEMIRRYLHMNKATVFVGAGFSLNAEIPEHVSMKTWPQLRQSFLERLYPNSKDEQAKNENDVIRLASLIEAQFGHQELDNILEQALPDALIQPGELHRGLVMLPWKDILTTNYDTLLERAAEQTVRGYKLVINKDTLIYNPSPRIIKLHGSFGQVKPYIMTQEDFRKYPTQHPELVNTIRQCFIESLVCLIGFSGDDPNFQSWQGWLRDVMGMSRLCPTYLITYSHHASDAERLLMIRKGIDIVNLGDISELTDYKSALEFFLSYLKRKDGNKNWNGRIAFYDLRG